jgi:hypothetical protein
MMIFMVREAQPAANYKSLLLAKLEHQTAQK